MNMNIKKYRQIRVIAVFFIAAIVAISVNINSYLLAGAAVATGMLFLTLVRSKTKIIIDEREKTLREKAAQMTYAIFTPTLGIGAFLLILFNSGLIKAVKEKMYFLESLGIVLAYLTLFLLTLYAISYYFLNQKYGGRNEE